MKNKYTIVTRKKRKVRIARKNALPNLSLQSGIKYLTGRTVPISESIAYYTGATAYNRMDRCSFMCNVSAQRMTVPASRFLP